MADVYRETKHHHYNRKGHRHCPTCTCHEQSSVLSIEKVRISSPKMRLRCSCPKRGRKDDYCQCCNTPREEWQPYRERYISVSPTLRVERKIHCDHKFALLENWFKRFDFDGNGLLDVFELKNLLNYLGLDVEQDYVKDLIDRADRDRDGMLSFSDFLHMWHQAAKEDDVDLYEIVKEHELFPDIPIQYRAPKRRANKTSHVKATIMRKYGTHRDCSCGNFRKFRINPKEHELEIETKIARSPLHHNEKLPLLSCYR